MKKTIYVIIIFVFVFLCTEVTCRICGLGNKDYINSNEQIYKYDDKLGWFLNSNLNTDFKKMGIIKTNSIGFRDIEHNYKLKTKKRIMFIGDSFTFGDKISQKNIFVELLRDKLKEYELFNCGVSGYGTAQEYLLLLKYFNTVSPDIVFLTICFNDINDNMVNYVGQYYKPLFIRKGKNLFLYNTTAIPKSYICYKNNFFIKHSNFITFILKNFIIFKNPPIYTNDYGIIEDILLLFKQFLTDKNCTFYIGLTNSDDNFEKFLKSKDIKYIVLENKNTIENDIHWNEKGHEYVADKIYNFFKQENIIK